MVCLTVLKMNVPLNIRYMLGDKKTITLKYGMSYTKIWNFKKQSRFSKSYRKYVNVLGLQSEFFG